MINDRTKIKSNPFLKKSTVGNVRKQMCDFTSDLNQISHQTTQMMKATNKINMQYSESLSHMRIKDKIKKIGVKLLDQSDLGDEIENMTGNTN